jgi:hypothetical protein
VITENVVLISKHVIFSSRLSLVSSRSQGEFPGKDDSGFGKDLSNLQQTSEPSSKRASFIEVFVYLLSLSHSFHCMVIILLIAL